MSILDKFRLDDRVALVTGGNRGLGREMALALAEAGAAVALTSRDQERADEAARGRLRGRPRSAGRCEDTRVKSATTGRPPRWSSR